MRKIPFHLLAFAALLWFPFASSAAAQTPPSAVLSSIEVRQLVERAQPADSARLAAHFRALAKRYASEAERHRVMSQGFLGNPSRNLNTGMGVHCKQLGQLNTESAATLGELGEYFEKMASGQAPAIPPDIRGFTAGAGAPAPTDDDLGRLAATASTPADHRRLEEYFLGLAKRYSKDARDHAALATNLRGPSRAPTAVAIAAHCDRLAKQLKSAAVEASGAAALHKELTDKAR